MNFVIEPNQITVQLQGFEKFWALKNRLQIPYFAIANITYNPEKPNLKTHWAAFRFPGTSLPGILVAGTYYRKGERDFWYLNMKQAGVLTMEFKPKTLNYDRTLLSCTPEIAGQIIAWWRARVH